MNSFTSTFRQRLVAANICASQPARTFTSRSIAHWCLHQASSSQRLSASNRHLALRSANHTYLQRRHESSKPNPLLDPSHKTPPPNPDREEQPSYKMTFTCRQCAERSSHNITKQGYHHGTILITCPGCKGRHLISDHLKIFSDKSITLEDILKEKGEMLKKGHLGANEDVEFWEDGTETKRGEKK